MIDCHPGTGMFKREYLPATAGLCYNDKTPKNEILREREGTDSTVMRRDGYHHLPDGPKVTDHRRSTGDAQRIPSFPKVVYREMENNP
eukprot:7751549-Heterocapsa_arctica.AAC.1